MRRVLTFNHFATLVYWYSGSPQMKVFLDWISDFLDLPELLGAGRRLKGKRAYVARTQRRETYATTGPRMVVRLFGGWEFEPKDAESRSPRDHRLQQRRADAG